MHRLLLIIALGFPHAGCGVGGWFFGQWADHSNAKMIANPAYGTGGSWSSRPQRHPDVLVDRAALVGYLDRYRAALRDVRHAAMLPQPGTRIAVTTTTGARLGGQFVGLSRRALLLARDTGPGAIPLAFVGEVHVEGRRSPVRGRRLDQLVRWGKLPVMRGGVAPDALRFVALVQPPAKPPPPRWVKKRGFTGRAVGVVVGGLLDVALVAWVVSGVPGRLMTIH